MAFRAACTMAAAAYDFWPRAASSSSGSAARRGQPSQMPGGGGGVADADAPELAYSSMSSMNHGCNREGTWRFAPLWQQPC